MTIIIYNNLHPADDITNFFYFCKASYKTQTRREKETLLFLYVWHCCKNFFLH